jgi:hypothetical protein
MTWNDEIVEEVRRVRQENAEKFNFDISAICADIRKKQAESERKVIVSIEQNKAKQETSETLQSA